MKYKEAFDYAMLVLLRTNVYRYWVHDELCDMGSFVTWHELCIDIRDV